METFVVDKNSWHYKLVREHITDKYPYDLREKAMPKDFCSYWWRVVIETLKIGVMFSVFSAALVAVVGLLGYMIYAIFFFGGAGLPFLLLFVIVASVVSITAPPDIIQSKRRINKLEQGETGHTTTNIFVQRYKAWKGKFCPAIQYEKES